jgi:hypothetical protein
MTRATFRHTYQLTQFKKLNPEAHAEATDYLSRGLAGTAAKIVAEAVQAALPLMTDPRGEQLWQKVVEQVESQDTPMRDWQDKVGELDGEEVSLYRRPDNKICLYLIRKGTSAPIAFWGWDWDPNHQSSAYTGTWKLTDKARRNFEAWLNPVPNPRRW